MVLVLRFRFAIGEEERMSKGDRLEELEGEEKEDQRGRKNHTTTYLFVSDSEMLGCVIA